MASGKLSPRQKMINMMYLVLIALLALNISNEILKAFHLMEVSFVKANQSLTDKNTAIMKGFKDAAEDPNKGLRAKPWAEKAAKVQAISAKFCKDIDVIKADIEKAAGGRKELDKGQTGLPEMSKGDDMEGHKHYLGTDETTKGKGDALRVMIDKARQDLISVLVGIKDDKAVMKVLDNTTAFKVEDFKDENGTKKTWERDVLGHSPVAGVMAMLTKVQNDCKALETDVLTKLAENIDATTLKFDKQLAIIMSESTNVMSGSSFKATVALAAYNSTSNSKMFVNGSPITVTGGLGQVNIPANGVGSHTVTAKIETLDPNTGQPIFVEAPPIEYTTFLPSATISADKMNVLYVGLDNPMSISVPGVAPGSVTPSPSAGLSLKPDGAGKYNAIVTPGTREVSVSVTAKMPDGTSKQMGKQIYRVKNVPKPEAKLGPMQGGAQSKLAIAAQPILSAVLDNFVFEGVSFKITKYSVTYMPKKGMMEGPNTVIGNSAQKISAYASKSRPGDMIAIDGIRAVGPGGKEVALNAMVFTIQ